MTNTELVELMLTRRSALAQAEEAIGELFSVARRERALPRGYGHARSPQIAQRVAITGLRSQQWFCRTTPRSRPATTAIHFIAPTLLVVIDISKHRHHVLIGVPGKKQRTADTMNGSSQKWQDGISVAHINISDHDGNMRK